MEREEWIYPKSARSSMGLQATSHRWWRGLLSKLLGPCAGVAVEEPGNDDIRPVPRLLRLAPAFAVVATEPQIGEIDRRGPRPPVRRGWPLAMARVPMRAAPTPAASVASAHGSAQPPGPAQTRRYPRRWPPAAVAGAGPPTAGLQRRPPVSAGEGHERAPEQLPLPAQSSLCFHVGAWEDGGRMRKLELGFYPTFLYLGRKNVSRSSWWVVTDGWADMVSPLNIRLGSTPYIPTNGSMQIQSITDR